MEDVVERNAADRFDVGQVRAPLSSVAMPRRPAEFGIDDDLALLGSFPP